MKSRIGHQETLAFKTRMGATDWLLSADIGILDGRFTQLPAVRLGWRRIFKQSNHRITK